MSEGARTADDVEEQIRRITRSLKARGGEAVPDEVIERTVRQCVAERQDARIRDFVNLLAERSARERLRQLAGNSVA